MMKAITVADKSPPISKKELSIRLGHKDILFENEDYIAINKKRGWPVHQTVDPNRPNLYSACKAFLKNRQNGESQYLALHHRLDVKTSGIVLFAKTERANPVLASVFEQRKATKTYLALCVGTPADESGQWTDFLQKKTINKIERMIKVDKGGQKAITKYKRLKSYQEERYCLLELELITGRMHQIRVQASIAGHPLLGDDLYGNQELNRQFSLAGQMLHAHQLEFFDPLSKQQITIQAPLPDDFLMCEKQLENGLKADQADQKDKTPTHTYILFHKPYNTLCQFTTPNPEESTLADFGLPENVYPVGRLDKDSEGLLLLTDDGKTKDRLAHPRFEKEKCYWVQVEKIPSREAIKKLSAGLTVGKEKFLPCKVSLLDEKSIAQIPERVPPIRQRQNIPTCWLAITITEGKNRQVRRMTAAVGHPTLRLIRQAMDGHTLEGLKPGEFRVVKAF